MGRPREAPPGFQCPYRDRCPHLDGLSARWTLRVHQEHDRLQERYEAMEAEYLKQIQELREQIQQRDRKIARLQLDHQKHFKANVKPTAVKVRRRRRGAPPGHPAWKRREVDHIDCTIDVPAPAACPFCHNEHLLELLSKVVDERI